MPGFAGAALPVAGVAPGAAGAGLFFGSVKNWNPMKGWGFIQCQATEQMYGKDIFVMKSAVASGGNLTPGTTVRFSVQTGLKGVEAANVTAIPGVAPSGAPSGVPSGGFPAPSPRPPQGPAGEQVYFGVVKAFHEEKGW